jgi:comEA protein
MIRTLSKMRALQTFLVATLIFGSFSMLGMDLLHAATKASEEKVVNVNKATLEELVTVRGIGPALAERIIQFRKEKGPFQRLEDLVNVRGIGTAKLEKIKSQVTV